MSDVMLFAYGFGLLPAIFVSVLRMVDGPSFGVAEAIVYVFAWPVFAAAPLFRAVWRLSSPEAFK